MSFGPADTGFDLLPPDPALGNPDIALDAALAPDVTLAEPEEQPLGKGWLFDFVAGQFMRRGSSPAEAFELDNLAMWINKCLLTMRGAHAIYSEAFGIEDPFAPIGTVAVGDELAAYQDAIVEALTVHDRIASVEDFSFNQDPSDDGLFVSFTVVLDSPGAVNPQSLVFTDLPVVVASQS